MVLKSGMDAISSVCTETEPKIILNVFRSSSIHSTSQNESLETLFVHMLCDPSGKCMNMNTSKDWRIFASGSVIRRALPAGCRYRDVSLQRGGSRQIKMPSLMHHPSNKLVISGYIQTIISHKMLSQQKFMYGWHSAYEIAMLTFSNGHSFGPRCV